MQIKYLGYFVPIIIIIALLSFLTYILLGYSFNDSILTFITILVIACPCSLGLATPLAVIVSEGICAKNGIVIKNSEILEKASKITTIVFDKTGTLTYGKLKISKIYNYSNLNDDELITLASSLELQSSHPISTAFSEYMQNNNIQIKKVKNFENIPGYGIKGIIENSTIILGNRKILSKYNISIENNHILDEENLSNDNNSIIYVIKDNNVIGLIGVNDILRDNSKDIISRLNKDNIKTIMLTGDNDTVAEKVRKHFRNIKNNLKCTPTR